MGTGSTHMNWTELIGYAGAILTTGSLLPQVWLTFRTRDVSGISLGTYSVLWSVWPCGWVTGWPTVLANAITLALAAFILWMKPRYR